MKPVLRSVLCGVLLLLALLTPALADSVIVGTVLNAESKSMELEGA